MGASRPVSVSLLLALALAPAPRPASVEIDRATFHALTAASPVEAAVPAWAAQRVLNLTPAPGGVLVRATWTLRSLTAGAWFSGQVLGDMSGVRVESVLWNGAPVATAVGPGGVTVAGKVSGRANLEVVAFVPGDPVQVAMSLRVMPAARGQVIASAPAGLVPLLRAAADTANGREPAALLERTGKRGSDLTHDFVGAVAVVDLSFGAPPAAPGVDAAVVVAKAGLGLTVGDAELRGRGRLVWELRRGSVSSVRFTATGVGADLEVTGPGVREVQRSGDDVRVLLQSPVTGRLELGLQWTSPIGKAAESRVDLPQIRFDEVFRAESSLQLARDGEVEAVPAVERWTPSSAAGLPAWGQGLVEGAPTAAFTATTGASGHLDLLRFVPIEGPPVVVDVAAYTIATSREGRALMRAHYEVRNERAATLRVRPPPGMEIVGVRVAGATAVIARDRDGSWRVPLPRSVDTVSGLLSFPVEVGLLGEAVKEGTGNKPVPWARRERRSLPLPRLDAPIAVLRVTLHLPPGYRSRLRAGDGEVVAAFTRGEGITYGLGVGAVGAAEADALFQGAVKRWLDNDFGGAQAGLDELKKLGANNENIERLQGNLDLIAGRGGPGKQDAGVSRRIREQAKARAVVDQVEQKDLERRAEVSRRSGDYKSAEVQYRAALEVGDRLAKLEQTESVEQSTRNDQLRGELESNAREARQMKSVQVSGKTRRGVLRGVSGGRFYSTGTSSASGARAGKKAVADGGASVTKTPPAGDGDGTIDLDGEVNGEVDASVDEVHAYGSVTGEPAADRPASFESAAPEPALAEAGVSGSPRPEALAPPAVTTPVGGTSRDFSAVTLMGAGLPGRARQSLAARRERRQARAAGSAEVSVRASRKRGTIRTGDTVDTRFKPGDDDTSGGLAAPVVTASALSVVVPTLGAAVLYERALLPPGAEHAVDISAREPRISRD